MKYNHAIVPLGNIECNPFIIDSGIEVVQTPIHMNELIRSSQEDLVIRDPDSFKYCLKLKTNSADVNDNEKWRERIERIILLFRLFKAGDVYFNYILFDNDGWFDNSSNIVTNNTKALSIFYYKGWQHKGLDSEYRLSKDETEDLTSLINDHINDDILSWRPYNLFFRGYHEPYTEDRFLRNAIALENIFVNDTQDQSNIRYKFIDRGYFLLQLISSSNTNECVDALKNIYDYRCKLVHSSKKRQTIWNNSKSCLKLLQDSDNYVRQSLKFLLKNPGMDDSSQVDQIKRGQYSS